MKNILLAIGLVVLLLLGLLWIRRRQTPALNVGPNPVLKPSDNVRPQDQVGMAILGLAPKVLGWFSQPTNPQPGAPSTAYDYDSVVASYTAPGTYGGDEEDPY